MKNEIYIEFSDEDLEDERIEELIQYCIQKALEAENVQISCEINVLITDDDGIKKINQTSRNIDQATDVLSFPMFEFTPGKLPDDLIKLTDPDTGLLPLGDMCISLQRARTQAQEFGHSLEREVGYLTIHSVLHLLGYDHMDEGAMKEQMRRREEEIMSAMGISR